MKLKALVLIAVCLLGANSVFAVDTKMSTETWTGKIIAGTGGASDYWFQAGEKKFELTGMNEKLVAPFANQEVKLTGTMNTTKTSIEVASVAPTGHTTTTTHDETHSTH